MSSTCLTGVSAENITFNPRIQSIIIGYASCADIIGLVKKVDSFSVTEFRNFLADLARQDACDLYNALTAMGNICNLLTIEPFKKCYRLFDKALSGRVYRSIVKSMLFSFLEDPTKYIMTSKLEISRISPLFGNTELLLWDFPGETFNLYKSVDFHCINVF